MPNTTIDPSTSGPIVVNAPASVSTKIPENSLVPRNIVKPTVSAAAALGLPESPKKTMDDYSADLRGSLKLDAHVTTAPRTQLKPSKKKADEKTKEDPKPAATATTTPPATDPAATPAVATTKPGDPAPVADATPTTPPPAAAKPADIKPAVETDEVKTLREQMKSMEAQLQRLTNKPVETPKAPAADPEAEKRAAAEIAQLKEKWITEQAGTVDVKLTPEEHDAILEGGPEAVKKLVEIRKKDIATAALRARETIYEDIKPVLAHMEEQIAQLRPVYDDHQSLQRMRVEESFKKAHPEMAPRMTLCKQVAQSLVQQYPDQIAQMTEEQVFSEVARQTKMVLEKMGIVDTPAPAAAPVPVAAVVTPPAPAPAAAPIAPKATPKPPASMAPSGVPAGNAPASFSKTVAASLV